MQKSQSDELPLWDARAQSANAASYLSFLKMPLKAPDCNKSAACKSSKFKAWSICSGEFQGQSRWTPAYWYMTRNMRSWGAYIITEDRDCATERRSCVSHVSCCLTESGFILDQHWAKSIAMAYECKEEYKPKHGAAAEPFYESWQSILRAANLSLVHMLSRLWLVPSHRLHNRHRQQFL